MTKISACVISFNEEDKIEACLESLLPVVDEIVVVDSQSADRTREIAGRYTDKVIIQPFLGYVAQKNFATQQCRHDWILSLDCDERLSPRLQESILAVKDKLDAFSAYSMPRKTFYVFRWLEHCWYPDRKPRLFNRNKAHWQGVNVHEWLEVEGNDVGCLEGDILHYSFDSISDHLDTIDRFTEIGAQEIIQKGKKVGLFSPVSHGLWTFLRLYLFKGGFRDGLAGFVVSFLSGVHAFVKYAKVLFHYRKQK